MKVFVYVHIIFMCMLFGGRGHGIKEVAIVAKGNLVDKGKVFLCQEHAGRECMKLFCSLVVYLYGKGSSVS